MEPRTHNDDLTETVPSSGSSVLRFSSRRQHLGKSFLNERLKTAESYDLIAGYFSSSILEVAGEALESMQGMIRMVCNSDLHPEDIETARTAALAVRRSWCQSRPEQWLEGPVEEKARERFNRLFVFLRSGKLQVRVLPDQFFGLIHGKAGVIRFNGGEKTSFMGSANESRSAWEMNYELIWEDRSPEAISWVQEEFDALWGSPYAVPLCDFVIEDLARLSRRRVLSTVVDWVGSGKEKALPKEGPAVIETPVYRQEAGLWDHQKYFVQKVFEAHQGPVGKARFVLADQVGLGKTLQLAISALLIALIGERPILVICPKTLQWQWLGEMRNLLDMPSAVWDGRRWVDEGGIQYPLEGAEGIRRCPRRVGIVSSGLRQAYELAEEFCRELGRRMQSSGFLKTLLLRRMGSCIHSGWRTAAKMLASWEALESEEDPENDPLPSDEPSGALDAGFRALTSSERALLERYVSTLEAYRGKDPKFQRIKELLMNKAWLREGCIVFSQYRDSILWLAEQLTRELPEETIAVYSGPDASGLMKGGEWHLRSREELKQRVAEGSIRLMLGTDAASEGLNLQRLSRLINLDLPWNPTRLEQRKGRIQRIGQVHDKVWIYNMRYKDSVEDRVHELLGNRLNDIHALFGQIPDVLEDVWISVALDKKEQATKIIDSLPHSHPFEIRYAAVEKIDWETCREVLARREKERILQSRW